VDASLTNGAAQTGVDVTLPSSSKEDATKQAKDVQAILQSGALPVKAQIVGAQGISADLGSQFENGALAAGLLAIIMVSAVVFIRYRRLILVIPIIFTTLAELLIILGVASVIHWNIDLPAIAGILAAIGTGVDDQIIITDEVLNKGKTNEKTKKSGNKRKKNLSKIRINIKAAFFIIFASAATLIAAMMPLAYYGFSRGYTGIGMLSAFAFTTILGVLIGIFITRPVYAKFVEKFV
jgi:preprotein translocase subunit SecD